MITVFFESCFKNYIISMLSFICLGTLSVGFSDNFEWLLVIYAIFLLPFSVIIHFAIYLSLISRTSIKQQSDKPHESIQYLMPLAILPSVLFSILILFIYNWELGIEGYVLLGNTVISAQLGFYQFILINKKINHDNR